MTIELPETVEPIIAWVRGMSPRAVVGQCQDPHACIIAEYLCDQYPAYFFEIAVMTHGTGSVAVYERATNRQTGPLRELPSALNTLALRFDEMADEERLEIGGEASMITAGEFLEKWEAV